jgi:glycosyltransferase involved in cell wall biosynthesis
VFLAPKGPDTFENIANDAGFTIIRPDLPRLQPLSKVLANIRYGSKLPHSVKKISDVITNENIDIVHASMTINYQAGFAAAVSDTPLIWYFNDTGTPWPVNKATATLAKYLSDEVAVAAEAVHEHFFTDSIETRTIYPPIDTEAFDPEETEPPSPSLRSELGIDADVPLVGTIGNINPVKGHKHLLRAVDLFRREYGAIAVVIVGKKLESREKYYQSVMNLRERLELSEETFFLGYRSDVPEIMAELDMFVLPSVSEASPITILEAMAMELPVVATNVGGVPEQVSDGETGWLVQPKDPQLLASSINEILSNEKEANKRAKAARRRVKRKYSMEQCVKNHVNMYNDTIDK